MFDDSSFLQPDYDPSPSTPAPLDIELVLLRSTLPKDVRSTSVSRVFERLIDADEIARLTDPYQVEEYDSYYTNRIRVRRKALTNYLDSTLTCVLIRLPGVTYTIEIDPISHSIVHWEWQQA